MSVSIPLFWCYNYCSFEMGFWVKGYNASLTFYSSLFFLFGLLYGSIYIFLVCEKISLIFWQELNWIESTNYFGSCRHFKYIDHSNPWVEDIFLVFVSSSIYFINDLWFLLRYFSLLWYNLFLSIEFYSSYWKCDCFLDCFSR